MRRTVAALLVFVAATDARADDEGVVRHVVKANETCAAIAQKYYGNPRLVDVLHRANPALGAVPPPHGLQEGTVLVIPPRPVGAEGPDARLTIVRNRVDVLNPETKPGKPNDPLFRGNRVSTQEASAADVTFRDETQIRLGERTLVIILGDMRAAAARVTSAATEKQTTLVTGNLRAWMGGGGESPRKDAPSGISTASADVRVFTGEALVTTSETDPKKTTRLAVYAGSSAITALNKTQEVTRGFGSKAELGKPPTPPRPLPSPPAWTLLPVPVHVHAPGDAPASIAGEYDVADPPKAGRIAEWHVQIARDVLFRDLLADTLAPAGVRRFEVKATGPGHYYARVSAIDDDRFEGPFGRAAGVLVVRATVTHETGAPRRTVVLDPPDSACMRVGNVRLTWVKGPIDAGAKEPVVLRCAPTTTASDPTTLLSF